LLKLKGCSIYYANAIYITEQVKFCLFESWHCIIMDLQSATL